MGDSLSHLDDLLVITVVENKRRNEKSRFTAN